MFLISPSRKYLPPEMKRWRFFFVIIFLERFRRGTRNICEAPTETET